MNDELEFDDYPTLHLHMMIDDYDELCREANKTYHQENVNEIEQQTRGHFSEEYRYEVDLQGRFSFCFNS